MKSIKAIFLDQISNTVFKVLSLRKKISVKATQLGEVCNDTAKLRYNVYSESGYINTDEFPDNSFSDEYDKYSTSLNVYHKGKLIGSLRLTHTSQLSFPTEKMFNLTNKQYTPQKTIEVGRLVVDKEYRGKNRLISFALCVAMHKYSRENEIENWLFSTTEKLASKLSAFGGEMKLLESGNLLEENLNERAAVGGYYKKYEPLPYLINVKNVKLKFPVKVKPVKVKLPAGIKPVKVKLPVNIKPIKTKALAKA